MPDTDTFKTFSKDQLAQLGGRLKPIPGLPQDSMTPQQQLEAAKRVSKQAEERIQLGMQLFKAAEAHILEHRRMADKIKQDQEKLREQVNEDVTKSLHAYDQWVGRIDENFTKAIRNLESRIDQLQDNWQGTQQRIEEMLDRSEKMIESNREKLSNLPLSVAPPKKTQLKPQVTTRPDPQPLVTPVQQPQAKTIETPKPEQTTAPQPIELTKPVVELEEPKPTPQVQTMVSQSEPQQSEAPAVVTVDNSEEAPQEGEATAVTQKLYTNLLSKLRNNQK